MIDGSRHGRVTDGGQRAQGRVGRRVRFGRTDEHNAAGGVDYGRRWFLRRHEAKARRQCAACDSARQAAPALPSRRRDRRRRPPNRWRPSRPLRRSRPPEAGTAGATASREPTAR